MSGWCKVWVLPKIIKWIIPKGYAAAAIWPLVLLRDIKFADPRIIYHEQIHLRQQIELGILPFYLIYLIEYVWHRCKGKNHHDAYKHISFEREAYAHDHDFEYLKNRKWWNQWRESQLG